MAPPRKMRPGRGPVKGKTHARSVQEIKDDSIMNTNDSSIVSKRCVSKLYFSSEPDFYEPFVGKYTRRNPLINRGYWLRMHAVEQAVRQFLVEDSQKTKIVVNLGCGYDPLPFQFWHRYPDLSKDAVFVDVDYPQLIGRKRSRMLNNDLLRDALLRTNLRPAESPLYLRSDKYMALGCDLKDLATLEKTLRAEFQVPECSFLFVAEVSLTYMPLADSDALVHWANTLDDAKFCMLEQYLPQGPDHPFAQTMLKHFDKLQTPIQAVKKHKTLSQHSSRFLHAGWTTLDIARNLWDLWSDETFTPPAVRRGLDAVEPFDEWEEFALFAGHYFLIVASNTPRQKSSGPSTIVTVDAEAQGSNGTSGKSLALTSHTCPRDNTLTPRRFGAAFSLDRETAAFHGGQGLQRRLSCIDLLGRTSPLPNIQPFPGPDARICHSITSIDGTDAALLVGGRGSPAQALADCWLIKHGVWQQVHELSPGRYRHSSTRLSMRVNDCEMTDGILVFGGKTSNGTVLDEWTVWTPNNGWQTIPVDGARPCARFGAAISTMGSGNNRGLVVGGMDPDGTVLDDIWEWHVSAAYPPQLKFTNRTNEISHQGKFSTHARVGATLVPYGDSLLLIGGVNKREILSLPEDFLVISCGTTIQAETPSMALERPVWPLLVGAGVLATSEHEILIVGGGAVCFSMGSFWNEGYISISRPGEQVPQGWTVGISDQASQDKASELSLGNQVKRDPQATPTKSGKKGAKSAKNRGPKLITIPRVQLNTAEDFQKLIAASKPAIIEGQNLGSCTERWTLDYLKDKLGADREVVVHDCDSDRMTFASKNFQYVKKPLAEFIDGIAQGSRSYLRSASSTQPNRTPTNLEDDFPAIASDFELSDVFAQVKENQHSSPLRISGPVTLWLHYDVLANILCQIRGTKTLYLFPPGDVSQLSYAPGSSSSNRSPHSLISPSGPATTHPHLASLSPSDILFIPPMWSHTATPESSDGISIAINIFFKNLDAGYAAGKDVYGNRDLAGYENGRRDVDKIVRGFKGVPADLAKFYLDRLAGELVERGKKLDG